MIKQQGDDMKKIKYVRETGVKIPKYNLTFNKENDYTVNVEDDIVDKIILNPTFELVKTKKKSKGEGD